MTATIDAGSPADAVPERVRRAPSWRIGTPFILLHVAVVGVIFVGWSWLALAVCALSYLARTFAITAFYHRGLSHRAFRTSRFVQFCGASIGASAAQRGPLWWVAHHRTHHRHTDRPGDPHSPVVDGFWYSHVLWIFDPANAATDMSRVRDLARFRELRLLDRYEYVAPGTLVVGLLIIGAVLGRFAPALHTSALQLAVWGFVLPTVALYHSTFSVNSLAHRFGRRRFETADHSRNNWLISLLVLGEGWHNNHHRFPGSAHQGVGRFELDPTWWGIRALAALGLARRVRSFPAKAVAAGTTGEPAP
jgi:stearoyl-CoA desaturase (delta-9 desaturase)